LLNHEILLQSESQIELCYALPLVRLGILLVSALVVWFARPAAGAADGAVGLFADDFFRFPPAFSPRPDDGYPDLASTVRDVMGDPRDPHYNDSNYRAMVSLPGWKP